MYFFFSLLPATFLAVVGYFVLFSSTRTAGAIRTLGQILAIWVFVLAALLPVAGAYATYAGIPSMNEIMRSMHPEGVPRVR
jgi:hypothetical protein